MAHFNFFISTYKISKDKTLLKEKKNYKRSSMQMAVIDVHPKVFHIKDCGTSTVRWCSLHFHMLREIKVRRMDISIRCYAMNLTYRSSNVLLFAIEKKSIINT